MGHKDFSNILLGFLHIFSAGILRVIKPSVSDYTQLYASGIEGQDTCEGNSGNALVKIQSSSWVLEGVMSYRQNCWEQNRQPVCIAVSSFDQWIRSNLRQ